ncbi:ScpA/B-like protein [Leptospira santarosai str. CBC1416]|uniref:Segregation and condensation protein A n=1 Tax=Leptospira santarosai str. CBC1416 TaxID=1193059 RepID=M6WDD4_9LEPT|nr:ScpA/B-like protein [Leptospira santarosai str. CBC1416]
MNEESGKSFVVQWNNGEGGLSEGPLSVLWSLIESYKVDIFDVALSRITRDFLNFLRISETLSLELSAEYALMAANLIYLKSKALLPDPGFEEEDYEPPLPPELVEKLLEHKNSNSRLKNFRRWIKSKPEFLEENPMSLWTKKTIGSMFLFWI